jgi:anti-anti-sigma factor
MTEPILTVRRIDRTGPVPVLAPAGEIDHDSRAVLSDAAEDALAGGGSRLVIDMTGVSFCDSGGLSLLVDLHRRTSSRGGSLRLAGTRRPVLSVIQATNLHRLLHLDPTVDAAMQAASSPL